MSVKLFLMLLMLVSAAGFQHNNLRFNAAPSVEGVQNGEIPTAGEALGDQAGVNIPNPHQYTGALVGGGVAGTVLTLLIFLIASYFCWKWNGEIKEKGDEAHCGLLSCLCCCCCTPLVCCFPIDGPSKDEK